VLTLCEQLAERYFAPHYKHYKLSDSDEPVFDGTTTTVLADVTQAFDAFSDADLRA
jgi:hypothetical protein